MTTCNFYYLSLSLRFKDLCAYLQSNYKTDYHKDVIHLKIQDSDVFVFEYGSVVFWNASFDQQQSIIEIISEYSNEKIPERIQESIQYQIGENEHLKIANEIIFLSKTHPYFEMLACSYAIAQSINLDYFESSIEKLIIRTKTIPQEMATTGKISMPATNISKLIGEILLEKHSINLHFNLLEKPDFFWEYSEFEKSYLTTFRFLEIESRVDIMNKKLSVLQECVDILSNEQKHHHSSYLEKIVIWLIVIEIILNLLGIFGIVRH
jgi:uncharacterized Rmd1/YagE family protein